MTGLSYEWLPHKDTIREVTPEQDAARRKRESEEAAKLIRTHNEQVAAEQKRREEAAAARGAAELEAEEEKWWANFRASGGQPSEWPKVREQLRSEYLAGKTRERVGYADQLRERMRPGFPRL